MLFYITFASCKSYGDNWEENDENSDHDQGDNDEILDLRDGDNIREILQAYLSSI